jgi:hypothetical protein
MTLKLKTLMITSKPIIIMTMRIIITIALRCSHRWMPVRLVGPLVSRTKARCPLPPEQGDRPRCRSCESYRDARDECYGILYYDEVYPQRELCLEKDPIQSEPIYIGSSHGDQAILMSLDECLLLSICQLLQRIFLPRSTIHRHFTQLLQSTIRHL